MTLRQTLRWFWTQKGPCSVHGDTLLLPLWGCHECNVDRARKQYEEEIAVRDAEVRSIVQQELQKHVRIV